VRCPHVHVGGRAVPAFQLCGVAGFLAGTALAAWLGAQRDIGPGIVLAMAMAAAVTFLATALATKVVTGTESLTFYHHAMVALATCIAVAAFAGAPLASSLDLAAIGLGVFLACGRVGCLVVGCCHGRPWSRGVRYGLDHAAEGFPSYLVGVRLVPVQAAEAVGVAVVVAGASVAWLRGAEPGAVLAGLVVTYGGLRFVLEFARGDAERRYLLGFSEGQWTSLAVCGLVVGLEAAGVLPWQPGALAVLAGLASAMVVIPAIRRRRLVRADLLCHPRHVRELALAADHALVLTECGGPAPTPSALPVNHLPIGGTSLGLLVSAGIVDSEHGPAVLYAFSHRTGGLSRPEVERVAQLLLRLRHHEGLCRLVAGDHGVSHLIVAPGGS
jgi:prolipoprotein diacylglyceryltransferase